MTIDKILEKDKFTKEDIISMLSADDAESMEKLRIAAHNVLIKYSGHSINLRGLVEFSNYCTCDCNYCGIRKSNTHIKRYKLSRDEVVEMAKLAVKKGFGSFVLQSGDRSDPEFINYTIDLLKAVKEVSKSELLPEGLGITLCIGEQTLDIYKRIFEAGAHRYLLRIETTNRKLFSQIHPDYQDFDSRMKCLEYLDQAGYQVGTGVMIGLPGQTIEDLANDILFFKSRDIDMIGMGPYIVQNDTPMARFRNEWEKQKYSIYQLSLRMIAATRLVLKDVNIASTTALETIHPSGKKNGLAYGGNVIMPLLTPESIRKEYNLYDQKPVNDPYAWQLDLDTMDIGYGITRPISKNQWGDAKHFAARKAK